MECVFATHTHSLFLLRLNWRTFLCILPAIYDFLLYYPGYFCLLILPFNFLLQVPFCQQPLSFDYSQNHLWLVGLGIVLLDLHAKFLCFIHSQDYLRLGCYWQLFQFSYVSFVFLVWWYCSYWTHIVLSVIQKFTFIGLST